MSERGLLPAAARDALSRMIAEHTDLDVTWSRGALGQEDDPGHFTASAYAIVSTVSSSSRGQDGVRYELDGESMVGYVVGQRELTVRVQAFSDSFEPGEMAEDYLEELRAALRLPNVMGLLVEHNLGLIATEPVRAINVLGDDRVVSRAVLDIRVSTAIQRTDRTGGSSTEYIETADVEITLTDGGAGDMVRSGKMGTSEEG